MRIVLSDDAIMPSRAHPADAGLDLYSTATLTIPPFGAGFIDTGVHVEIPAGYVGMLTSKSSLMKKGITSRGTIDCGYTGSIKAVLINHSQCEFEVKKGQKITQLVLMPIITPELEVVEDLEETERGAGGFGSTGE